MINQFQPGHFLQLLNCGGLDAAGVPQPFQATSVLILSADFPRLGTGPAAATETKQGAIGKPRGALKGLDLAIAEHKAGR